MSDTDIQLLARYTRHNDENAFAEMVHRHLDLVHSAALRQVRSPQLAEDVAQSTFTDLARNAHRLAPNTILTAWLYQVTRRTAIDVVRRESRRQLREQIATEMNAMNATADDWAHVAPLLDEAMQALEETDRAAVLLRYFENKSLREVGQALGTSDDTAQKRVSRAVERLRTFFAQRGLTVGASSLAVVLSANAVQAAPVGLAVTIATTAAVATTATAITSTTIATTMNWINLKSLTAVVAAAVAAGTATHFVQQREVNRLRNENQQFVAAREQLTNERDAALSEAANGRNELARVQKSQSELLRLRGEVGLLRRQVNDLARLQEENRQLKAGLARAAQSADQAETESEADPQRKVAIEKMSLTKELVLGLIVHAQDNHDQYPTDFDQVLSVFKKDPADLEHRTQISSILTNADPSSTMLSQFEIVIRGSETNVTNPGNTIAIREKEPWLLKGKRVKVYGWADGHSEVLAEPPEGFEAWERQHMVSPQPSR